MTPGRAVDGLGKPVEPDVRSSSADTSVSGSGDRRRYCCTKCRGEVSDDSDEGDVHRWDTTGSKLVPVALTEESERGHAVDISTWCDDCECETWHVPAGGVSLGYYRWRNAQLRRRRGGR